MSKVSCAMVLKHSRTERIALPNLLITHGLNHMQWEIFNLAFQVGGGHFVGFSQREELQGVAPLYRLGEVNAGGHLIGAII